MLSTESSVGLIRLTGLRDRIVGFWGREYWFTAFWNVQP